MLMYSNFVSQLDQGRLEAQRICTRAQRTNDHVCSYGVCCRIFCSCFDFHLFLFDFFHVTRACTCSVWEFCTHKFDISFGARFETQSGIITVKWVDFPVQWGNMYMFLWNVFRCDTFSFIFQQEVQALRRVKSNILSRASHYTAKVTVCLIERELA